MNDPTEFGVVVDRLRLGDQSAAAQIVRDFEPEVRRFIRFRLSCPALRRAFDSLDIFQSVFGKFFVQISKGDFVFEDRAQLRALLLTMARNKLYDRVRQEQAARRDGRRMARAGDDALAAVADPAATPSEMFGAKELLAVIDAQLTDDERYLVNERLNGREWGDLAAELKATPEALRKRMTRALDDAAQRLGIREN